MATKTKYTQELGHVWVYVLFSEQYVKQSKKNVITKGREVSKDRGSKKFKNLKLKTKLSLDALAKSRNTLLL